MDVIIKRNDGIVEIDGEAWMTRESLMSANKIKKSNFYNLRNDGHILSQRLFSDKKTVFFVYRMREVCND